MNSPPLSSASSPFRLARLVDAVEQASVLDLPAGQIGRSVRGVVTGRLRDALSGTWLGHSLHPLLTDVVIGSFTSASLLDLLGGDGAAAERLIALGIISYPPTALSGLTDWSAAEADDPAVRRAGLVHAGANAVGLSLYIASLRARRTGSRSKGALLGFAGWGVMGVGGYLGGHLVFVRGVGVAQTAQSGLDVNGRTAAPPETVSG